MRYNKRMIKALMFRARSRGFTIVELIVTIAVIGIITSIAVVAFNTVQTKTRDDVREADVAIIMDALEQYYRKNGDYPANDTMNPSQFYPTMTNFDAIKGLLPTLTDSTLSGPGGYRFYPGCINSATCVNSSDDWKNYMKKSYIYLSRFSNQGPGAYSYYNVPASYGDNTGWGCTVRTYYTDPGYMMAWYSESKKLWIFKRSQYGQVDISTYSGGPVAPQTCAFS